MDKLISETYTSSSLALYHAYATYAAEQLPYIWMPDSHSVMAVASSPVRSERHGRRLFPTRWTRCCRNTGPSPGPDRLQAWGHPGHRMPSVTFMTSGTSG